jgi:hypothetical protein
MCAQVLCRDLDDCQEKLLDKREIVAFIAPRADVYAHFKRSSRLVPSRNEDRDEKVTMMGLKMRPKMQAGTEQLGMRKPLEDRGKLLRDAADCPLDRLCRQSVSIPFVPLCIHIDKPLANAHMYMCHIAASPRVCGRICTCTKTRINPQIISEWVCFEMHRTQVLVYAVTDVCKSL